MQVLRWVQANWPIGRQVVVEWHDEIIDDEAGRTLVAASTNEKGAGVTVANVATATKIGQAIAQRAQSVNISRVVFDRGGYFFHGKVKALADAAREAGLQF